LKASRIDSLYKDVEDDEAELWMVSVLRGAVGNGGAMVRLRRIRTVVVFVGSQRRRKGKRRSRWRREEGGRGGALGFVEAQLGGDKRDADRGGHECRGGPEPWRKGARIEREKKTTGALLLARERVRPGEVG
jgi:hypothetical protein